MRRHYADLLSLKQGKLDTRSFVTQFNSIRSKMTEPLPVNFLVFLFLRGLRSDLQSNLAMQDPKDLATAFTLAISISDAQLSPKPSVPPVVSKSAVSAGAGSKPRDVCTHCHKPYHTAATCYELHPELKKAMGKKPKKN
jgi:hypothetical protein